MTTPTPRSAHGHQASNQNPTETTQSQPTAAGKLTTFWSPRALLRSLFSVPLVFLAALAFSASPAFAAAPPVVVVGSTSVTDVGSTSATLSADVNAEGSATTYRFEDSSGGGGFVLVPGGEGGAGAGSAVVPVSVHVQGLTPKTEYRYRVVATNAEGKAEGERGVHGEELTQTFTTQPAGSGFVLPDGREWELVSPPDKFGGSIQSITEDGGVIQASESGGAVTYVSVNPPVSSPLGNRALQEAQVLSTRGAHGWSSEDIATPNNGVGILTLSKLTEYAFFSPDLSLGLVEPNGETPLPPLAEGAEKTIYLRNNNKCAPTPSEAIPATCYVALVSAANTPPGTKISEREDELGGPGNPNEFEQKHPEFEGASPDLSHVVLKDAEPLVAGAGDEELYEWSAGKPAGEQLQIVSVLPGNGGPTGGVLGGGNLHQTVRHAVSNDGSRVIWNLGGNLYLRDMGRKETVEVSAPEPGGESGGRAVFQSASSDGSRVFFTDEARLTANSTASSSGSGAADLYVFEVTSGAGEPLAGRLTDLTVDANAGEHAAVQGEIIGASEDGSYVYFVANGLLGDASEPGVSKGDCFEEEPGRACNLYVEHFGGGGWGAPEFIATLSGDDWPDWDGEGRFLAGLTARVSPDGRWVAFMSDRRLTGYDNVDVSEREGISGEGRVHADEEVFLFDVARPVSEGVGGVVDNPLCASCDPSGARPVGVFDPEHKVGVLEATLLVDERGVWKGRWLAGSVPGWTSDDQESALYQSRYLSNNGRLFFDGADSLVAADVSGREDVYEFEPGGVGGCGSGVADASWVFVGGDGGCVGLISSGTSSEESAFLDASAVGGRGGEGGEGGGDVFFLSASQLAPKDEDQAFDVYDAHECSAGSPCPPPQGAVQPACNNAESCRSAPVPQPPIFGPPPSATFNGQGNITPETAPPPPAVVNVKTKAVKCKKPKKLTHGKCVRARATKRGKAKR
jgi:hypothetical protein